MPLWSDSLTLVGLACLTVGTGAQAWASRADFKSLALAYEKIRQDEAKTNVVLSIMALFVMWILSTQPNNRTPDRSLDARLKMAILGGWYLWRNATWSILRWPWYARKVGAMGGDDAVELARLLRSMAVWAILCLGSVLVLVASVLTLIHDA